MEQLTKNQAVATSQEAVQNQNEPQLRDENAHNDKSGHGVLNPTYQAGLRRDAVQSFFFQAEDGIRDLYVTGVQTCALPICPIPIIAAVNGVAAGAGAVIALAADIRILARAATFAFLFTKVGLAGADMGSAYLLPRIVGFGRATELLLLGDTVDAETAERFGLATLVVEDERLLDAAGALAHRLAGGPALAYANTKAMLTRELDVDLATAIELEAQTQAALLGSHDHREFHASFVEKREPR